MKFNTILLAIAGTVLSVTSSCSSSSDTKEKEKPAEHIADAIYQCPMQCEGGKAYPKAGNCPVCEMEMVEVEQ